MGMKPTCPVCGEGITLVYMGAVLIDTQNEIVTHGGITGGKPESWVCYQCGHDDDEEMDEYAESVVNWLKANYPISDELLETGLDWSLEG